MRRSDEMFQTRLLSAEGWIVITPSEKQTMDRAVSASEIPCIFIVDDDESVREAIRSLLRSLGFKVLAFASAEEFLNSGLRQNANCLILDVRMSGMSGLELQRQLAADDSHIPILFISAHGDEETRARAMTAGAVDFLDKPFSEEALLRGIRSALRNQGQQRHIHENC